VLTRRDVLKGAAALGASAVLAEPAAARTRERIAIVGAGAGGVAAAYFLAGSYDVEVFEARSRIGGHADSRRVAYAGHDVTVDLGAQFFHPDTHPLYTALLEQVGLDRHTRASAGSLCVFPVTGGAPRFTSTHPLDTLPTAVQFATFTQLARAAITTNLPWETTVAQWISGLPLDQAFKDDILTPWITATIGCSHADAQRVSARSILQTFALAFPADPAAGAKTYNSKIGLQGNLQHLLDRVPAARVHRNAPITKLARTKAGWMLRTPSGSRGPFKHIIMNAPPRASRALLRPLPAFRAVTALLDQYTYFDSRLLIHSDPAYAYRSRADWTAYNAGVDGRECEGSAWVGALHDPLPGGAPVDLFKSWATRRRADPKRIMLQRRFQHPLISPRAIAAARGLDGHQGHGDLWFSGAYTTGADLQETALYSAMEVAGRLAPASPTLAALQARIRARGDAAVSYDL
jgi:predicted NAD/FAD-binding protein